MKWITILDECIYMVAATVYLCLYTWPYSAFIFWSYSRPAVALGTLLLWERGPMQTARLVLPLRLETETSWCAFCQGTYCFLTFLPHFNMHVNIASCHGPRTVFHIKFHKTSWLDHNSFVHPNQGLWYLFLIWDRDMAFSLTEEICFSGVLTSVTCSFWIANFWCEPFAVSTTPVLERVEAVTTSPQNCHLWIAQKRWDFFLDTEAAVRFLAVKIRQSQKGSFCKIYLSRIVWEYIYIFKLHSPLHSDSHTTAPKGHLFQS